MTGDVRFARTVLLDAAGSTSYPPDEALGLPMGDRVSPSMRDFLVTCGADVPFGRTSRPRLTRRRRGGVQSEGKGWEYPHTASVEGMRANVRYEAALDLI